MPLASFHTAERAQAHVAMRAVATTMEAAGAAVGYATLPAHVVVDGSWWAQLAVAVWCTVTALALLVHRADNQRVYEATAFMALAQIGVMVAVIVPVEMIPSFLFWPIGALAYFSARRLLVVALGAALTVLAVALLVNGTAGWETFVVATGEMLVLAWLVHSMTARQEKLRSELASAAMTDPLTGLLNRRAFHPQLEQLVAEASAGEQPLTLVMLDLDHFKRVNDTYGHLAGDAVLERVAAVLRRTTRHEDLVARLGGEEFAVALTGANEPEALAFASRVAAGLSGEAGRGARALPGVGTSAGICELDRELGSGLDRGLGGGRCTADELLRHADEALYAAKLAGRGRPAVWGDGVRVGEPFDVVPPAGRVPVGPAPGG